VYEIDSHEQYGEIVKEAGGLLDKYVVPVFCQDKFGRPEMEGTGFFIEHNLKVYFITASHVLDAIKSSNSDFLIAVQTQMISLPLLGFKQTMDDDRQFDLAAFLISPADDNYGLYQNISIPTHKTTLNNKLEKVDMEILQGFPISKNKTAKRLNNQTKNFEGALWTYSFSFFQNCDFYNFNKHQDLHYAINWPKKIKGQKTLNPRGCSGGPYWFIPDENKINGHFLAGVFIEYYEKDEIAFVTKIDNVIELIAQFDALKSTKKDKI